MSTSDDNGTITARVDRDIEGSAHAYGIVHRPGEYSWSSPVLQEWVPLDSDGNAASAARLRVTGMHIGWGDPAVVVDASTEAAASASGPAVAYASETTSSILLTGDAVPSWLAVDPESGAFSGDVPSEDAEYAGLTLTATGARTGLSETRPSPITLAVSDTRIAFADGADSGADLVATYDPATGAIDGAATSAAATNPSGNAIAYALADDAPSPLSVDPSSGAVSGVRRAGVSETTVNAKCASRGRETVAPRRLVLEPARFLATRDSDRGVDGSAFDVEQPDAALHPLRTHAPDTGETFATLAPSVVGCGFVGVVPSADGDTALVVRFRAREAGTVAVVGGYLSISTAFDGPGGAQTATVSVPGVVGGSAAATLAVERQGPVVRWVTVSATRVAGTRTLRACVDGAAISGGSETEVADCGADAPVEGANPNAPVSIGFDPSADPAPAFDCDVSHCLLHAPSTIPSVSAAAAAVGAGVVARSSASSSSAPPSAGALDVIVAGSATAWGDAPPALDGCVAVTGPASYALDSRAYPGREWAIRLPSGDAGHSPAGEGWVAIADASIARLAWGASDPKSAGGAAFAREVGVSPQAGRLEGEVADGWVHVVSRDLGARWPASETHDPNADDGNFLDLESGGDATASLIAYSSDPAGLLSAGDGELDPAFELSGGAVVAIATVKRDGLRAVDSKQFDVLPGPVEPTWSTASSLSDAARYESTARTLSASNAGSYAIVAGSVPAGVSFSGSGSSATVSGSPSGLGTFAFTVRAYSTTASRVYADRAFSWTVATRPSWSTSTSTQNFPYYTYSTFSLNAGSQTGSYGVVSGSLPSGFSMQSSNKRIYGRSSDSYDYASFTVRAYSSGSSAIYADRSFSIRISRKPVWTSSSISSTNEDSYVSRTVQCTYADSFARYTGTLPPGISIGTTGSWGSSGRDLRLTGTPHTPGTYSFGIRAYAKNASSIYTNRTFTWTINSNNVRTYTGVSVSWSGSPSDKITNVATTTDVRSPMGSFGSDGMPTRGVSTTDGNGTKHYGEWIELERSTAGFPGSNVAFNKDRGGWLFRGALLGRESNGQWKHVGKFEENRLISYDSSHRTRFRIVCLKVTHGNSTENRWKVNGLNMDGTSRSFSGW